MVAIACPHCGNEEKVVKFGSTASGSARLRCGACERTFTPQPKSRALTAEKQAAIEALLAERISQRGIARAQKVSRDTVRLVRKKGQSVP